MEKKCVIKNVINRVKTLTTEQITVFEIQTFYKGLKCKVYAKFVVSHRKKGTTEILGKDWNERIYYIDYKHAESTQSHYSSGKHKLYPQQGAI